MGANPPARYRIFVGAFPGGELVERIQLVRLKYDRRTAMITAPHVSLAGTYWRSGPATLENEAQTIASLQEAVQRIRPFNLRLGGIRIFPPVDRPVIYLAVEETSELLQARCLLLESLGPDKHHRYNPHLTLAMRLRGVRAAAALAELNASPWNHSHWSAKIDELQLMQRGETDSAWRALTRFPLASG